MLECHTATIKEQAPSRSYTHCGPFAIILLFDENFVASDNHIAEAEHLLSFQRLLRM